MRGRLAALRQSRIVIAVIGKSWLSISDEVGRRRIDLSDDCAGDRVELETKR